MTSVEEVPRLCIPHVTTAETIARLREDLRRLPPFDPIRNVLGPAEARTNPEVALRARLRILARTYSDDYHTDSFDFVRLAQQVRDGHEAIWFWGAEHEIERLRGLLRSGTSDRVPDLDLGTVTVLDAAEEFGPGYGELCRSGSTDRACGARAPIVARTLGFLDGGEPWLRHRYHTLELTSRARASEPGVRGGEAIHRIHSRYARSRFWGFAPFYVMQGGVLERLEYRESNRDPDEVLDGLRATAGWHFSDPDEASFATSLVRLNFGIVVPTTVVPSAPRAPRHPVSTVMPKAPALVPTNHGSVVPVDAGRSVPARPQAAAAAVERLLDSGVCCATIWVDLEDPANLGFQAWLGTLGFNLTAVVPPKRTWLGADRRRRLALPSYGIWCRPRPDLAVAEPFYNSMASDVPDEEVVLRYLRARLQEAALGTSQGRGR